MPSLGKPFLTAGLALCLASAVSAQRPGPLSQLPTSQARSFADAYGVSRSGGQLLAGGPGYHVTFAAEGPIYTPALPTAERLFPLRMRCTGYGRGKPAAGPGAAELSSRGDTVSYHRAGFVETYEARRDGLKQSFVFSQLPAGAGDLVVRVALDTDLTLAHTSPDGALSFLHGDHGGVTIGKVVGVDADGARCEGSMSYVDGRVDMRLPADFVDGAALPVVLDPLVGTAFGTNGLATAFDDENLDVAYDATEDVYLATWTRKFASGVTCVRGQRINDVGNLVGGVETIACPGNYVAGSARVANVASQDAFLVVFYTTDHDILGSAVSASPTPGPGGGASAVTVILDNADDLIGPDVGGEATELDDEAIVVWANSTQGSIQAKQVHLDGAVTPPTLTPLAAVVDIATSSGSATHTYASISNSGGQTGDHLIAFNTTFSFSPNTTVRGTVVSRDLVIRDMSFEVSQWFLGDCDFPSVDGDGRAWVVAYEAEASPGTFDNDIEARAVVYSSSAGGGVDISSIATISDQLLANERNAQVCWLGDSALVTYETNAGTSGTNIYRAAAQPVDLLTARPCGGGGFASSPNGSGADHEGLRGVSKAAGGAWSEDDALMVWSERDAVSSVNTGYAQRYRADDGVNVTLGGRCGSPGYGYASNAKVGNADFAARLVDSRPGQAAWLVFSSTRIDLPCGACTLVPDPFQGILLATTTSAAGVADVALPIPNDPSINGAVFFHQWLVSLPAGTLATCASLGTEVSDALQTTIQ